MSAPGVAVKFAKGVDNSGIQWIKVDVVHQLQQVGIGIAKDRMIAILEQMSGPLMAAIKSDGMPGEQTVQDRRQTGSAETHQQRKVIGHLRPSQPADAGFEQRGGKAVAEGCTVDVVVKDIAAFNAVDGDVMSRPGMSIRAVRGMAGSRRTPSLILVQRI